MGFIKEFREFAVKGNVVDMAVGIIIGAAFGKIVSSFVNDVIMPPIGMLMGQADFSKYTIRLKEASVGEAGAAIPAVDLRYGLFINNILDFIIVAFAVFMMIKAINRLKRKEEAKLAPAAPAGPPPQERLLMEIRDILKRQS